MCVALCLPLLYPPLNRPAPGELWLDLMDVGQGLAAVLRTTDHTLLYDAGPPWRGPWCCATRSGGTGPVSWT